MADDIPLTSLPMSEESIMAELARNAAARRMQNSVRPLGGRQEGIATRLLDTYIPEYLRRAGEGVWDQMSLPSREPVPPPHGLMQDDAGRLWIGDKPAHETPEGAAFIGDQRARNEWAPGMALSMMGMGRFPGVAPAGAVGTFAGQKPPLATVIPFPMNRVRASSNEAIPLASVVDLQKARTQAPQVRDDMLDRQLAAIADIMGADRP